jgi:hypothetical protein
MLFGPSDSNLVFSQDQEASFPGRNLFHCEQSYDVGAQRLLSWLTKTNQQNAAMVAWLKLPDIGEVEILGNEEPLLTLSCLPQALIGGPGQVFVKTVSAS